MACTLGERSAGPRNSKGLWRSVSSWQPGCFLSCWGRCLCPSSFRLGTQGRGQARQQGQQSKSLGTPRWQDNWGSSGLCGLLEALGPGLHKSGLCPAGQRRGRPRARRWEGGLHLGSTLPAVPRRAGRMGRRAPAWAEGRGSGPGDAQPGPVASTSGRGCCSETSPSGDESHRPGLPAAPQVPALRGEEVAEEDLLLPGFRDHGQLQAGGPPGDSGRSPGAEAMADRPG